MKRSVILVLQSLILCAAGIAQDYTWQQIPVPDPEGIECAALGPQDQMYLGMNNGQLIWKTTDRGANWISCPVFDYVSSKQTPIVYDIEVSPSGKICANINAGVSYIAGFPNCGFFCSSNGGNSWDIVGWHDKYCGTRYMTMAPNGDIYYGDYDGLWGINASGGSMGYFGPYLGYGPIVPHGNSKKEVVFADNGLLHFYRNGESVLPHHEVVGSVYINNLSYIYNIFHGDVSRSKDEGANWQKVRESDTPIHEIEIDGNNIIYLATADGVVYSLDHGDHWNDAGLSGITVRELDWNARCNLLAKAEVQGQSRIYFGECKFIEGTLDIKQPASDGYEANMLDEFEIKWDWTGNVGTQVQIDLYEDHAFKKTIAGETPNDGDHDWIVTRHADAASVYQFKITSKADAGICAFSPLFYIVDNNNYQQFKFYEASEITDEYVPVIDGSLDDALWDQVDEDTLDYGRKSGEYQMAWDQYSDALVTWKAVWCKNTNKVYAAVRVQDDIRGAFDNGEGSGNYAPHKDESIEIMTDGSFDGGNYWELTGPAQFWRVTAYNLRNLFHYPVFGGDGPYEGDDFITAVQLGGNGDWTCEMALTIYDDYPTEEKNLLQGDMIGWDLWYNDSDNETNQGSYYDQDHQIGWCYLGPSWKEADYSGDLILAEMGSFVQNTVDVDIVTDPCDAGFTVDGDAYSGSASLTWDIGQSYTIEAEDVCHVDAVRQYLFYEWSDGGGRSHQVTASEGMSTLTAYYTQQVLLYTSVQSGAGGTVSPSGGNWVDANTDVDVLAAPDAASGYVFKAWAGDASGSENPLTVTMDAPKSIFAVFELSSSVTEAVIPDKFDLAQNFPNPFNPETRIAFDVPEAGDVSIHVFNLAGRKIRTLVQEPKPPGSYQTVWDGRNEAGQMVSSGTYIFIMRSGEFQKRMKAVFLK
ncbi:hypothetical protein JW835_08350 [bacterium]|nr:hypothetical protein [bacterium]